jgi:uncharacterized protein YbjQ (UPF0145 family)
MRWLIAGLGLALVAGCGSMGRATTMAPPSAYETARETHGAKGDHDGDHDADHDDEPLPTDAATIAKAASVRVIQNEALGCAAEALGPVDVHKKMENTHKALEALKLRAAALGADAVTGVDFEHGEGGSAPTHLSGMAVRCKDLVHGRTYDVMGEITVKGAMGKEEAAFSELRAKARAMKADLILGVKFDHGEGGEGEGTTLTGTAIRFRAP